MPSPLLFLAYRLLGWRLGPSYRTWVHADITGRGWLLRQGLPVLSAVLVVGSLLAAAVGGDGERLLSLLVVLSMVGLFLRKSLAERALRQQGLDPAGNPAYPWYDDPKELARRNWVGAVTTVVLVVSGLLILALRSR
jgi:hypothetical protein